MKRISAYPLKIVAEVPPKLDDGVSLTFVELDMVFDGGSHVADFRRNDGGILRLWFPHAGYWTSKAKAARSQPVGIMVLRDQKAGIVEILRDSLLQKRIVELLAQDIAENVHPASKAATLTRIKSRLQDRNPLQEIGERMDKATGKFTMENDTFEPKTECPF